jgi:hypothetical protein
MFYAARTGDGWLHGGGDPSQLSGLLARLAQLRREARTAHRPFQVHVISRAAFTVDGVRRLEEQGITDVIIGFRWPYTTEADTQPLAEKIGALNKFAEKAMAKKCRPDQTG